MTRRKILCWTALAAGDVLAGFAIMYPTWLTDYTFQAPWGDAMTWWRLWPLVCLGLMFILVITAAVCYPVSEHEPKTVVLERTSAPN